MSNDKEMSEKTCDTLMFYIWFSRSKYQIRNASAANDITLSISLTIISLGPNF
jgi:hypothetical protein